jgi:hypothetical protein
MILRRALYSHGDLLVLGALVLAPIVLVAWRWL